MPVGINTLYAPCQKFVDQIVRDAGYTDANYLSEVFSGEDHNEKAWHARLERALVFLLGERGAAAAAK